MKPMIKKLQFKLKLEGYDWSGLYNLEPYEPAEEDFPALLPYCSVLSLFVEGGTKNVYDVIDPRIIHLIEQQLVKEHTP